MSRNALDPVCRLGLCVGIQFRANGRETWPEAAKNGAVYVGSPGVRKVLLTGVHGWQQVIKLHCHPTFSTAD